MTEPRLHHGWLHAHTTDGCMVAIRADSIDIITERAGAERCVITTRGGAVVEVAADERGVRRLLCYPPAQEETRPAKTAGPWEPNGPDSWVRVASGGAVVARVWGGYPWSWWANNGAGSTGSFMHGSSADAKAEADAALIAAGWALS